MTVSTLEKETISITNDKGKFTKEDIEKMVAKHEKFAESDKILKNKIEAKHHVKLV